MVRCLGGFEVKHGDRSLDGFESQKVRGLFVYLLYHRERPLGRELLASLLWPERGEEAARRNLRQAVYNLKRVLPSIGDGATEGLKADRDSIQLHPGLDLWFDVEEFNQCRKKGQSGDRIDPHYLSEAAGIYRGDLLPAFSVKDSSDFEHWLSSERARLKEGAAAVFKTLVECYLARGELRLGTRYAHRLAAIDPLSEEAHRYLIRLYGYSGRRSRAVAQYEELRRLLMEELDIEPSEETQRTLQEALAKQESVDQAPDEREPVGPLLPMVGRRASYDLLEEQWRFALQSGHHVSLVCGEPGIGKTRLVRSFLDAVSSRSGTTVLKGRCDTSIPQPYQPIVQVLQNAFSHHTNNADFSLEMVPLTVLREVSRLLPDLAELLGGGPSPISKPLGRKRLFDCVARFLDLFVGSGKDAEGRALILFLDDLHFADRDSCDLLQFLARHSGRAPLWIVATCDIASAPQLLERLGLDPEHPSIELERLGEPATEEIAAALFGEHEATSMVPFLAQRGAGLPVSIAAWINYLWDEGHLQPADDQWRLTTSPESLPVPDDSSIDRLILQRLQRLPTSTRRLATLASILGNRFSADLLQRAEDEHMTVIALGLQILLERWLIQPHAPSWTTLHRAPPPDPEGRETSGDLFEFSHHRIRQAIYRAVSPDRRRYLHRRAAEVMGDEGGADARLAEHLGFHFANAGQWADAFPCFQSAARKAAAAMAGEVATYYYERADVAATRAGESKSDVRHVQHWTAEKERLRYEHANFKDRFQLCIDAMNS